MAITNSSDDVGADGAIPDDFVRVPLSVFMTIQLCHATSDLNRSIAAPSRVTTEIFDNTLTGCTKWAGYYRNANVVVAWDWAVIRDVIVVLRPSEIRTNIRLVGDNGDVIFPLLAKVHLLEWIESHAWRHFLMSEIPIKIAT